MRGHQLAVVTTDTYADLFLTIWSLSAALDGAGERLWNLLRTYCGRECRRALTGATDQGFELLLCASGWRDSNPRPLCPNKRATKLRHTPREATTAYRTGPVKRLNAYEALTRSTYHRRVSLTGRGARGTGLVDLALGVRVAQRAFTRGHVSAGRSR